MKTIKKYPEVALAKLNAPTRSSISIDRDDAFSELKCSLERKIVLISAPFGSAKTGFLAESYRRLSDNKKWRCSWLSVDVADEPKRFWNHLVVALSMMIPELPVDEVMKQLESNEKLFEVELGNQLIDLISDASNHFVLFLDDLDSAPFDTVSDFLNFAAKNFPKNMHVVASGSKTLYDGIDLVYRESVALFPDKLLNFTYDEIRSVLTSCLDNIPSARDNEDEDSREDVIEALSEDLTSITQGWPFGVRIYIDGLLRGMVDIGKTVDEPALGKMLNRFFRKDVLDRLSEVERSFIVTVALTDRTCPDLSNALTGRSDSKYLLRELLTRDVFLAECPGDPGWYEFHPLFRRWLRMKQEQYEGAVKRNLRLTASKWFEDHGMSAEAAKYLLLASDSSFIIGLVAAVGFENRLTEDSYYAWLERTPSAEFFESPQLALQAAWAYMLSGRPEDGSKWIEVFSRCAHLESDNHRMIDMVLRLVEQKTAEFACQYSDAIALGRALFEEYDEDLSLQQKCLLHHSMGESFLRTGQFDEALRCYLEAEVESELGESDFFSIMSYLSTVSLLIVQGNMKSALDLCDKALKVQGFASPKGPILASKTLILTEIGRFDEAQECIEEAEPLVSSMFNTDMLYEVEADLAFYLAAIGMTSEAYRVSMRTSLTIGSRKLPRSIDTLVYLRKTQVMITLRYAKDAQEALTELEKRTDDEDTAYRIAGEIERARLAKLDGAGIDIDNLKALAEEARKATLSYYEMELLILAAEASVQLGQRSEAILLMVRALRLQAGQHIVGPFLRGGIEIRSLLHEMVDVRKSNGDAKALAREMLRVFASDEADETPERLNKAMAKYGLTEREQEILDLLNSGLSRNEIASILTVSYNTVKSHITSIYNKLGVTNRVEAFSVTHETW